MAYKVAVSKNISQGAFIAESPVGGQGAGGRPLETTRLLTEAKRDFADQTAVDAYVTARGGNTAAWVLLDLSGAGVV